MPKEPSIYNALHYDDGCKELDDVIEEVLVRDRRVSRENPFVRLKALMRKTGRKETGHHWRKGD